MSRLNRILHKDDAALFSKLVQTIDCICEQDRLTRGPRRRQPRSCKFTTGYILENVLFMLKTGCTYREACLYSDKDHHYSTIFKRVQRWRTLGVFDLIYSHIRNCYVSLCPTPLTVYVDGSNIRNKNGSDHVDYGFKDKGKKGCRLTWAVDADRFPLAMSLSSSKSHDVTELPPIISELDTIPQIPPSINVVGDKAYQLDASKIPVLNQTQVTIITPPKMYLYKGSKKDIQDLKEGKIEIVKKSSRDPRDYKIKVISEESKKMLKKRLVVENTFASIKQFKKIANRYEKKLESFEVFVKLAMILLANRVLCKLEPQKDKKKLKKGYPWMYRR
jgi:transposase